MHDLADRIDARLPQTQCTKCGFDGCRPYAEAIAANEADIDRCPPGGEAGIMSLAQLLGRPVIPLDTSRGLPGPLRVARIDERHCIGCTLCIQACPVDAIVGANKFMHTVLQAACTGCDLCVAPCPVDCIHMEPVAPVREWTTADAAAARKRYLRRESRLQLADTASNRSIGSAATPFADDRFADAPLESRAAMDAASSVAGSVTAPAPAPARVPASTSASDLAAERKKAILAEALARARARRAS